MSPNQINTERYAVSFVVGQDIEAPDVLEVLSMYGEFVELIADTIPGTSIATGKYTAYMTGDI